MLCGYLWTLQEYQGFNLYRECLLSVAGINKYMFAIETNKHSRHRGWIKINISAAFECHASVIEVGEDRKLGQCNGAIVQDTDPVNHQHPPSQFPYFS